MTKERVLVKGDQIVYELNRDYFFCSFSFRELGLTVPETKHENWKKMEKIVIKKGREMAKREGMWRE